MMKSMHTYRLTFWIPAIVVSLFLILFGIQVYNEYLKRQQIVIKHAQDSLNDAALQLAHNLEYALANNDQQQAQSHIARFSLRRDASFGILVNHQQQIAYASRFAWMSKPTNNLLNHQQLKLINQAADKQTIQQHYAEGILNIAVPLTLTGRGLFANGENAPVLFLESNIVYQLNQVSQNLWRELLPMLLLFSLATLLLIAITRGIVLKPLSALKDLANQLSQQQFDLHNPLRGHTEQTAIAETLVNAGRQFKQYIAEISDREYRLNLTLQSIGDAVIVTDSDGLITQINKTACQLTGWSAQQALGQPLLSVFDIYHASTLEPRPNPVKKVLETGKTVALANHTVLYARDGGRYYISDTAAPIRAQDNHEAPILGVILVFQNVTQQYQLHQELRQSVEFLQNILRVTPSVTYVLDLLPGKTFQLSYITESVDAMTGDNAEYWLANSLNWLSRVHPDDVGGVQATLKKALTSDKPVSNIFRFQHHNGHYIYVQDHLSATYSDDHNGHRQQIVGVVTDISEQRHAEDALKLAEMVFENSNEGIIITDADNQIIRVNPAFTMITDYQEVEAIGQNPSLLQSGKHDCHFYQELWSALDSKGRWSGEIHNRRKNGEIYLQWLSITQVNNLAGQRQNYVAIMSDISKFREAEQRISFLAHHDVLTKLPNRALLSDRIRQAIITCDRHHQKLALLYMDLDRFKFVNDSLGHAIGDLLLIAVAGRLVEQTREQDTVCRTGGDEFIILLPDSDADGAAHVAQKLVEKMTEPFDIEGNQLFVSLSIGISIYPDNGSDAETLNKHADSAMYRAKHGGRNQYQFFTEEMHSQIVHKLELEHALRFALAHDELYLEFQPQIDVRANRITGAETLLRWQHPKLGHISPIEFIPVAEETGMINPIGQWILDNAIAQCKQWCDAGHQDIVIAVNLSAVQFNNPTLVGSIVDILKAHQLPAANLELEITESVAMLNIELTIKQLRSLADAGIRLSLDDFGTGYSSLNYLKKFPIDKLKIDQGFVFDMLDDEDDAAIVDAVITLARSLGLKTLAEGVETHAHLLALQEKGCDLMQGFYFSQPVSAEQFINLLNKRPLP